MSPTPPRPPREAPNARALQLIRESVHLQNRGESPFTPDSRLPQTVRRGRPRGRPRAPSTRSTPRETRNHTHPIDPHPRNPAQSPRPRPRCTRVEGPTPRARRTGPEWRLVSASVPSPPLRRHAGAPKGALDVPGAYGWYSRSLAAGLRMWSTNSSTRTGHAPARVRRGVGRPRD